MVFLDSNIWIYYFSNSDKKNIAKELVVKYYDNIIVSTQTLNELYFVLTRKKLKTENDAQEIIYKFINDFEIALIKSDTVKQAIEIKKKYKIQYFDALLLASAIEKNCNVFYSEDMHHKLIIKNKLTIINPYLSNS